jgi:hypothetical protein
MAFSNGHALIIGVGTYKHEPQLDVPITTYDAKEVAEVLRDENYCGYPSDQVTLLHDADATRDRIMQELDKLAKKLKKDDTLFLFYSGHGMHGYGKDERYYLTTHDSQVKQEEQFQRVIDNSGISEDELITAINAISARRIFQFFNACHSGALIMGSLDGSQAQNYEGTEPLPDQLSTLLGSGEGRVTITACREGEQSSFLAEDKLTFFGYALTEGLRGNREIPIEDGYITIFNLYSYIHRQVKAAVKRADKDKNQEPMIFTIMGGDLPIALHSGSRFKDVIRNFSNEFKIKVFIHIEKIDWYEGIYSLLHRVQFECYNSMSNDLRRIENKRGSFEDLEIQYYLDSMEYFYKELKGLTSNKMIEPEIKEWFEVINKAIQELKSSIANKDLNAFKNSNWFIKKVMNDETQATNKLLIKTAKEMLENLNTEKLEVIVNIQPDLQQTSPEIIKCINNLLETKDLVNDYIDICNHLEKIYKQLLNYRGELEDPSLIDIFIIQIKQSMILLEKHKLYNQLNELPLILTDWKIIENSRESHKLNSLLLNIKNVFVKINRNLKKYSNELTKHEDKLLNLNN